MSDERCPAAMRWAVTPTNVAEVECERLNGHERAHEAYRMTVDGNERPVGIDGDRRVVRWIEAKPWVVVLCDVCGEVEASDFLTGEGHRPGRAPQVVHRLLPQDRLEERRTGRSPRTRARRSQHLRPRSAGVSTNGSYESPQPVMPARNEATR